ncbi:hypothetical protein [Pukyongiella litopenaei]|uniref:Capsular polysaccharide biosynthesis protein n=1 Tax=Pukyongiella litopenaei TaxID=2605946 RepID=A0A2S0MSB8_9RHOB|nr:hypothetical protein [Pukyongiella litopenaei]AVO38774.1 hypothetical protein C6Y53_14445 [Pukyongiella litopenaei]
MAEPRILRIHLDDGLRASARAGQHNFINKLARVAQAAGYRVEYRPDTIAERMKSAARRGFALFHMADPPHDRALCFRRVYHYPFWAIERSGRRWDWHVARSRFDPADRAPDADRFCRFWRRRLFGEATGAAQPGDFIYVPLQGRLLRHRSFQSCAPIDMLRAVLDHDDRPVIATLHPGERYTTAELDALDTLARAHPRLDLRWGGMEPLLAGCHHVVTQNSAVAFNGYFFARPAVLFARVDFHHIAANVHDLGVRRALETGPGMTPDYAGYLHWFWQRMSINAGNDRAPDRIAAALARGGLPMAPP